LPRRKELGDELRGAELGGFDLCGMGESIELLALDGFEGYVGDLVGAAYLLPRAALVPAPDSA
jgi:hypothetical protein